LGIRKESKGYLFNIIYFEISSFIEKYNQQARKVAKICGNTLLIFFSPLQQITMATIYYNFSEVTIVIIIDKVLFEKFWIKMYFVLAFAFTFILYFSILVSTGIVLKGSSIVGGVNSGLGVDFVKELDSGLSKEASNPSCLKASILCNANKWPFNANLLPAYFRGHS
jgi:hypothetical protein